MAGGGWVSTHEDVTDRKASRAAAKKRQSLQALIDRLPDNLWVKDVNSRFVIANQITASRMGYAGPAELIGKTDLELLSPEIAKKFYADEQKIVRSGQPMIDMEECVFGARATRRGYRRRKCRSTTNATKSTGWPASRATSPSASWRTPCATGRRKSSK